MSAARGTHGGNPPRPKRGKETKGETPSRRTRRRPRTPPGRRGTTHPRTRRHCVRSGPSLAPLVVPIRSPSLPQGAKPRTSSRCQATVFCFVAQRCGSNGCFFFVFFFWKGKTLTLKPNFVVAFALRISASLFAALRQCLETKIVRVWVASRALRRSGRELRILRDVAFHQPYTKRVTSCPSLRLKCHHE